MDYMTDYIKDLLQNKGRSIERQLTILEDDKRTAERSLALVNQEIFMLTKELEEIQAAVGKKQ